jgi:Icc protein
MRDTIGRLTAIAVLGLTGVASAQGTTITGSVFSDANGNGVRDAGERGVPNVVVSNQDDVVKTDATGAFRIAKGTTGVVFVSVPDGFRSVGQFWRTTEGADAAFALQASPSPSSFTFIHASDTHVAPAVVARMQRFRAMSDSVNPAFVLITGDLVRDALRVGEQEATGYYDLFTKEVAQFRNPVWTVPGNHENFGIERNLSKVSAAHPLYGRAMYHKYRGPDYYSFTYGGVHFVGLNSVDIDDQSYYGHVDSVQVAWLKRDLAMIPPAMPVVTFNHIPFFTAMETVNGLMDAGPAPSVIRVNGKAQFRHNVSNARDILAAVGMNRYAIALAGHMHVHEQLRFAGIPLRFYQAAAVVGGSSGLLPFPSGITVYHVKNGVVDDGTFVPLVLTTP